VELTRSAGMFTPVGMVVTSTVSLGSCADVGRGAD
jgi:hypothetical protein